MNTNEMKENSCARGDAALATLRKWGWTNSMIDAALEAYRYQEDAVAFFEAQVAAGEEANREGIAAMRAAK